MIRLEDISTINSHYDVFACAAEMLPYGVVYKDLSGKFLLANSIAAKHAGFSVPEQMVDIYNADLRSKLVEISHELDREDELCLTSDNDVHVLGLYEFWGEMKMAHQIKKCIFNQDSKPIGITACASIITQPNVLNYFYLEAQLQKQQSPRRNRQGGFIVTDTYPNFNVTPKQSQVIFHLLRGKTTQEISKILNIKKRTLESHIADIKSRLGCSTITQIVCKTAELGLYNIIPRGSIPKSIDIFNLRDY